MQSEDRFTEVRDGLKMLNKMDFDKLIAALVSSEAKASNTSRPAAARVSQMLELRNLVKNLPLLHKALAGCHSQLLGIVFEVNSSFPW